MLVVGETGSGKSTQMCQYLVEAGMQMGAEGRRGLIGCTQPRRLAATTLAKRVAEEMGVRLGEEVGYSIRFDDCTGPSTLVKFMTDGMLMREYLMDPNLSRYRVLILDEAHERSINTDILFGLIKDITRRREDLRLIVTSATVDIPKFAAYFSVPGLFQCSVLTVPGRTHPVTVRYVTEPEDDYVNAALITVMQIHLQEPEGDILVFLTGKDEIDLACETLDARMKALGPGVPELLILPVYASLPQEVQSNILEPAPRGKRKVVMATNIAEASITIDGIVYVVDPGFCKQKIYNPKTGMDSMVVTPITQASARQRAGRAGRTRAGVCFRLYTEHAHNHEMLPQPVPEIQRSNLAAVVLQMKAMGVNDLMHFDFMDKPTPAALVGAQHELFTLGALDEEGTLTPMGRKMAEFPVLPNQAKVLLSSVDLRCSAEALTVVAMLNAEGVFYRPRDKLAQADQRIARFTQPEGDPLTLLAVYNGWAGAQFSKAWCHENFLQSRSLQAAFDIRKQLLATFDRYALDVVSCERNTKRVCQAIASGFFMNVAKKDPQEGYKTLVDAQTVYIHPGSVLFQKNPDWVLYFDLIVTSKEYMSKCMVVDPKWLPEVAPRFYKPAEGGGKMSKAKKRVKIEPLFDKFAPKGVWRLSKRVFA